MRVGGQLSRAVRHMHTRGQCHNDVKPPNIFLGPDGTAYLGDLGAARSIGDDADERTRTFLLDGHVPLSPDKASPTYDKMQLLLMILDGVGVLDLAARLAEKPSRPPSFAEVQACVKGLVASPKQDASNAGTELGAFLHGVLSEIESECEA